MAEEQCVFKVVQLFKNDTLGSGSYGTVCKAKCDQLLCAAKLLYPVLSQRQALDTGKEHRNPFKRFEEECQFLSRINHPNIVQYLGTYCDPETKNLVLLMELMDESLTHFLESSPKPLPYYTQVNLSYDIAQALAFLHSNGIIHRDLSSNNVLLLASIRAKITDFGMSKFTDLRVNATMTKCPGTPAYMSPEALDESPVYTDKLDNFSYGVLLIQIVTRKFPTPTNQFEERQLLDPKLQNQPIPAKTLVPELKRRQAHLDLIPLDQPLLPTALHCLKDNENERPTATQLCQTLTALKRTARYQESSQQDLHQLLREKEKQLLEKENIIAQKNEQLLAKDRELEEVGDMEEQLISVNRQLLICQRKCAALEQTIQLQDKEVSELKQKLASKKSRTLTWQSLSGVPIDMYRGSSAVIGEKAYFKSYHGNSVYKVSNNQWNKLPSCPNSYCTIVNVDEMLTTVGGSAPSNKLYSYINNQWVEHFSPMPTKRSNSAAVYTNNTLVVAGGFNNGQLTTVEILNTENGQWSSVSSLPVQMNFPSTTICGDHVYMHPCTDDEEKNSVYKCSLEQLVKSQPSSAIWEKITYLPARHSSLVTVNGHMLAVGGLEAVDYISDIYEYSSTVWTVFGHITSPRSATLTAVLPDNKLMVVGGYGAYKICELATITEHNT